MPATSEEHADLLTTATSAIMHEDRMDLHGQGNAKDDLELFMSQRLVVLETNLEMQDLDVNFDDFVDIVTTYKCKFCGFNSDWKGGLMVHLRSAHRIGAPITALEQVDHSAMKLAHHDASLCPPCDIVEDDGRAFHADPVPPLQDKEIFFCGQCNQGFLSLDSCKLHMMQEHPPEDVHKQMPIKTRSKTRQKSRCIAIGARQAKPESPKNECQTNVEPLPKRKIRTPKALAEDYYMPSKRRKPQSYATDDKALKCHMTGCNQSYSTEDALNFHAKCHVTMSLEFRCPLPDCDWIEAAGVWRRMATHAWRSHAIDTELERCVVCPYRCHGAARMKEHGLRHRNKEAVVLQTTKKRRAAKRRCACPLRTRQPSNQCSDCGRTFSDSRCLRKHWRVVHDKVKPHVCQFCGHASARKAMLALHLRQHTGEKPYACDQCDYATVDPSSLRRHRMRHSGEKPYKCPHCPYACIQTIAYKTHLKNKHPGLEGLFCCSVCSYRSVNQENYLNHCKEHNNTVAISQTAPKTPDAPVQQSAGEQKSMPEILTGNLTAAQLIYTCLNALSQKGEINEQADSHTITIQIPAAQGPAELGSSPRPIYVTVEQQNDVVSSVLDKSL